MVQQVQRHLMFITPVVSRLQSSISESSKLLLGLAARATCGRVQCRPHRPSATGRVSARTPPLFTGAGPTGTVNQAENREFTFVW